MAKKKEQTIEDFSEETVPEKKKVEFDTVALAIIHGEGKKRKVVEIQLDSKNLVAGEVKVVAEGENVWEAKYEFEMAALKKGFFSAD